MKNKKKVYSQKDTRGKVIVDCSECDRGGNGEAEDKCASGWKIKVGGRGSCFCGELLKGVTPNDPIGIRITGDL